MTLYDWILFAVCLAVWAKVLAVVLRIGRI